MMQHRDRDHGAVLVLTLILTVVLGLIVVALARYVTVGVGTSDVTDRRTETNADGAAAVTWAMEEFRLGNLDAGDCVGGPTTLSPPGSVTPNGSTVTVTCDSNAPSSAFPVLRLFATAAKDGVAREVRAVVQVAPPPDSAVRALDWSVDDVPLVP